MPTGNGDRITVTGHPDDARIRACLERVSDPEIPVLSVLDLGIVRGWHWQNDTLVVTVTPTYSGCPATRVIAEDIEQALNSQGIAPVRVETRLAPPWSSDWISARGRQRLHDYGIAPPGRCGQQPNIRCPRCNSSHTERVSEFGSTACKALYKCRDCLEPFDYFKCV